MKYELNAKSEKYEVSLGSGQYQTNQICDFCALRDNGCKGQMHNLDKRDPNGYCTDYKPRVYSYEERAHRLKPLANYIKDKQKTTD